MFMQQWTSGLGFDVKEGWRPWLVDNQVAGYVTKYDTNNFQFVTVKGSGHMVRMGRTWAGHSHSHFELS